MKIGKQKEREIVLALVPVITELMLNAGFSFPPVELVIAAAKEGAKRVRKLLGREDTLKGGHRTGREEGPRMGRMGADEGDGKGREEG